MAVACVRVCAGPGCGHELGYRRPSAKYCSDACRVAAYRQRKADAPEHTDTALFGALAARVTARRPITGPMRARHRDEAA